MMSSRHMIMCIYDETMKLLFILVVFGFIPFTSAVVEVQYRIHQSSLCAGHHLTAYLSQDGQEVSCRIESGALNDPNLFPILLLKTEQQDFGPWNCQPAIRCLNKGRPFGLPVYCSLRILFPDETTTSCLNITFPVDCGAPRRPANGSINPYPSTLEGTVISFQCDQGFSPSEAMSATCVRVGNTINGTWSPDPADHSCTGSDTGKKQAPNSVAVAVGVTFGVIVVAVVIIALLVCCLYKLIKRKVKEIEVKMRRKFHNGWAEEEQDHEEDVPADSTEELRTKLTEMECELRGRKELCDSLEHELKETSAKLTEKDHKLEASETLLTKKIQTLCAELTRKNEELQILKKERRLEAKSPTSWVTRATEDTRTPDGDSSAAECCTLPHAETQEPSCSLKMEESTNPQLDTGSSLQLNPHHVYLGAPNTNKSSLVDSHDTKPAQSQLVVPEKNTIPRPERHSAAQRKSENGAVSDAVEGSGTLKDSVPMPMLGQPGQQQVPSVQVKDQSGRDTLQHNPMTPEHNYRKGKTMEVL